MAIEKAKWRCEYEIKNKNITKHLCQFHYVAANKERMAFVHLIKSEPVDCDQCIENTARDVKLRTEFEKTIE